MRCNTPLSQSKSRSRGYNTAAIIYILPSSSCIVIIITTYITGIKRRINFRMELNSSWFFFLKIFQFSNCPLVYYVPYYIFVRKLELLLLFFCFRRQYWAPLSIAQRLRRYKQYIIRVCIVKNYLILKYHQILHNRITE